MADRAISVPIGAGSEPQLIEIDDARQTYGDLDDFGDVIQLCFKSPSDQCVYSDVDNFRCCIHCGRESVI